LDDGVNADGWVIIKDPNILGDEPAFRDTRVPFKVLIDYLEEGDTLDQFLEQYPSMSRELAITAIEEARQSLVAQTQVKVLIDECAPKALKRLAVVRYAFSECRSVSTQKHMD